MQPGMAGIIIRLVGFVVFVYAMAAYGQFISDVLTRNDYWTYALCLAATFAVGLWMDWRNRGR